MKRYDQIVFVCTSNTLLSPIAEGIYRKNSLDWMPKGKYQEGRFFEEPINPKVECFIDAEWISDQRAQTVTTIEKRGYYRRYAGKDNDIKRESQAYRRIRYGEEYIYTGRICRGRYRYSDRKGRIAENHKECFDELFFRVNKVIQKIEEQYWADEEEEK